jgi:hypothetical protein
MKKLFLMIALVTFMLQGQAQKCTSTDVPTAATAAFTRTHPTVKDFDWSKDGSNYKVEYEVDKADMSHCYDATGKLLETKAEIVEAALPAAALEYVNANCKADDVKEATKVTDAKGVVTYEVKIKGKHLIFDSNGKLLNSIEH